MINYLRFTAQQLNLSLKRQIFNALPKNYTRASCIHPKSIEELNKSVCFEECIFKNFQSRQHLGAELNTANAHPFSLPHCSPVQNRRSTLATLFVYAHQIPSIPPSFAVICVFSAVSKERRPVR